MKEDYIPIRTMHYCLELLYVVIENFFGSSLDTSGAWSKQSLVLSAKSTDHSARLSLTSNTRGIFWLDSVSAMPTNTFKVEVFHASWCEQCFKKNLVVEYLDMI